MEWDPFADARPLALPVEGVGSLRETLLIMTEHLVAVDPWVFDCVETKVEALEGDWAMGEQRTIELTIAEADLLLDGLRFTEAASVDLPWFPMVVESVRFMSDQLLGMFETDEWLAWQGRVG